MRKLALIAHDNKKVDLVAWATFNRDTLGRFSLIATRHTARLLGDKVGLAVEDLLSGPDGGDAQIAARVATRAVDAVFFFVDPLSAQPHDPPSPDRCALGGAMVGNRRLSLFGARIADTTSGRRAHSQCW